MKSYQLLTLFLSAAFAVPTLAQQTNPTTSGQPPAGAEQSAAASQSADSSQRGPIPPPTSKNFWDGDDPNLANLVTHPFANKKYVQRRVGPIRDRLNELDEITSENGRSIKDLDGRATQGIHLASEKVDLADQHATDAGTKAQAAQASATAATNRVQSVEQMVGNLDQYTGSQQTEIRFRTGETALSKAAKDALDGMAAPLKDQHSYIIEVRGYAAGRGTAAITSSRKMADSVVRYLVLSHQIPVYRIYTMSLGHASTANGGGAIARHTNGGRVEVSVMKNDRTGAVQH